MPIIDTTSIYDTSSWISQTPPNMSSDNYYLKILQEKIDADWVYRPNRAIIDKETDFGSEEYESYDVVIQSVKTDTGKDVGGDWRRIVYRNIYEPVRIGQRFKFAPNLDVNASDPDKNVWIAVNQDPYQSTQSQVVGRCNTTLGSLYVDEDNKIQFHYEPVIIQKNTSAIAGAYTIGPAITDLKSQLFFTVQNNKFTKQYYINQRFIVGEVTKKYSTNSDGSVMQSDNYLVYKIANIIRNDGSQTYDNNSIGLTYIYVDADQINAYDDVVNRIAYNNVITNPSPEQKDNGYELAIVDPIIIPERLGNTFTFEPRVIHNGVIDTQKTVTVTVSLGGSQYASRASVGDFIEITSNNGVFTVTKKKSDMTFFANFVCSSIISENKTLTIDFKMKLGGEF